MDWNVLWVYTGYEDRVREFLESKSSEITGLGEYKIMVPKRLVIEKKQHAVREIKKVLFPGYILIQAEDMSSIQRISRNTSKILKYLKHPDGNFGVIFPDEMLQVLYLLDDYAVIGVSDVFVENDRVRITGGPLLNYSGKITKIDRRKRRAKIEIKFNGVIHRIDVGINLLDHVKGGELENVIEFSV